MKEQNIWLKKAERGTIDSDEVALGCDAIHMKGDEHERDAQETELLLLHPPLLILILGVHLRPYLVGLILLTLVLIASPPG